MKNQSKKNRVLSGGFTLLEITIAMSLLSIVMVGVTVAMQQTFSSVALTSLEGTMDSKASNIVEIMTKELKDSGTKYSQFSIASTGNSITFARSTGAYNGLPVFGNQIRYYTFTDSSSGNLCLARSEVVSGTTETTILSNQLSPTTLLVTAVRGISDPYGYQVNVTGVNFTQTSAGVVTITVIMQQTNASLNTNTYEGIITTPSVANSSTYANANDNVQVTIAQAAVQLLNNL